ncbi:hypothetical protein J27TS7_33320 [Paenibacillus dendritiformis]|nr:hypothetical protein J27TS7_33320 [Paenibacillus dendritiformis]
MRTDCTPCSALFFLGYPQTPVHCNTYAKKTKGLSYKNLKFEEGQDGIAANWGGGQDGIAATA